MDTYYIYGLFNEKYPHTYIGYTTDINVRLSLHKSSAKTKNYKVYKYIRETGGWNDDWKMEVLETHECSKKFAIERERYYKELMGDLNERMPGRTDEEWRENNKEKRAEYDKNWRENNPEKMKAKIARDKLNIFTCECGSNLRWVDRVKHYETKKHLAYKNKD